MPYQLTSTVHQSVSGRRMPSHGLAPGEVNYSRLERDIERGCNFFWSRRPHLHRPGSASRLCFGVFAKPPVPVAPIEGKTYRERVIAAVDEFFSTIVRPQGLQKLTAQKWQVHYDAFRMEMRKRLGARSAV